jgi:hypothetical protein
MIVIIANNGRMYPGRSARAAVTAMWQDAPHTKAASLAEYMAGCAWRAREWNGSTVRCDSAAEFIVDMCAAGLLALPQIN